MSRTAPAAFCALAPRLIDRAGSLVAQVLGRSANCVGRACGGVADRRRGPPHRVGDGARRVRRLASRRFGCAAQTRLDGGSRIARARRRRPGQAAGRIRHASGRVGDARGSASAVSVWIIGRRHCRPAPISPRPGTEAHLLRQEHHAAGADQQARQRIFAHCVAERAEERAASRSRIGEHLVEHLSRRQAIAEFVEVLGKPTARALGLALVVPSRGKMAFPAPVVMRCHRTCSFATT